MTSPFNQGKYSGVSRKKKFTKIIIRIYKLSYQKKITLPKLCSALRGILSVQDFPIVVCLENENSVTNFLCK